MSKFNVGDKVVFTNGDKHKRMSQFYPAVGTVGIIKDKDKDDGDVLVDWGEAEGVRTNGNYAAKAWWCEEEDIKLCEYTDEEVWEMLKPKMSQFSLLYQNIDNLSQEIKNMVVVAYRSGYGRAMKGRDFMIKAREVKENPSNKAIEHLIEALLNDKMVVTFYANDSSYVVSGFSHALHGEQGMEIYSNFVYDSDGVLWADGYDIIGDPDCEMYVAIPFSEVMGRFDKESIKAMYCGKPKFQGHIEQWTIGKFIKALKIGNKYNTVTEFETGYGNSTFYTDIYSPDFKALVPIRDYLKHEGVNV